MLYLLEFFVSQLALLFAGRPIQAILNAVLHVLAWLGLVGFVGVLGHTARASRYGRPVAGLAEQRKVSAR